MPQNPTSPPDGSAPGSRREGVTIDLQADEVRRARVEPEPSIPVHDAAPEDRAETNAAERGAEDDSRGRPEPDAVAGRGLPGAARPSTTALLAASVAGGLVVALAIVLLALSGALSFGARQEPPDLSGEIAALRSEIEALRQVPADDGLAPLREQIAAMEETIAEMRRQGDTAAPDAALQELQTRLAEVERLAGQASSATSPDVDARLSELAAQIEAIRGNAAAQSETAASIAALDQRVGALETRVEGMPGENRVAAVETELEALRGEADTARALALSAAADALQTALAAGRPFAPEISALANLGADEATLSGLRPFAEAGVATLHEIRADFEAQVAGGDLSAPVAESEGTLDRLLQSARGLVEVRPAHPTEGHSPGAIVARMRNHVAGGDLPAALKEWEMLPEPIRIRSQEWANDVEVRVRSDALAAQIKSDALLRLSQAG